MSDERTQIVERPYVLGAVIRTGRLTHPTERTNFELEAYDGRPAVLVILTRTGDVVNASTLEAARGVLDATIAQMSPVEQLRRAGRL